MRGLATRADGDRKETVPMERLMVVEYHRAIIDLGEGHHAFDFAHRSGKRFAQWLQPDKNVREPIAKYRDLANYACRRAGSEGRT